MSLFPAVPFPLLSLYSGIVPTLTSFLHKGQCGKLVVLGGCDYYTGAPYFAAMTALTLGADLSSILCTSEAEIPLKSYSPDLMIRGVLSSQHPLNAVISEELSNFASRCHTAVIGPGLGLNPHVFTAVQHFINKCKQLSRPLVLDGDGLTLIASNPLLIKGFSHVILTPNAMEFRRLWLGIQNFIQNKEEKQEPPNMNSTVDDDLLPCSDGLLHPLHAAACETTRLAQWFDGVTIVRKGAIDIISNGNSALYCSQTGAPRRCGGQGDILSGSIGTFLSWTTNAEKEKKFLYEQVEVEAGKPNSFTFQPTPTLLAAYFGCLITRKSAELSFAQHGRSMLASHLIQNCETVMEQLFPVKQTKNNK
jgi:ATP-dependent NAD(P)H-hydrate dehydratase